MKKRLVALIVALSVLLLPSCSLIRRVKNFINDLNAISGYTGYGYNRDGTENLVFNENVLSDIDERFTQLDDLLAENDADRNAVFQNLYIQQLTDLYYLADHMNLAFVRFCKDTSNESVSEEYNRLSKILNEKSARFYRYYRMIYESAYSESFYSQWDKEEIEKALEMSDMYTEEHVEIQNEVNDSILEYEKLNNSSSSYNSESARLYENIVAGNILLADSSDYENYADYAYKMVYNRDYTPQDAQKFYVYVKDYIVPLAKSTLASLRADKDITRVNAMLEDLTSKSIYDSQMIETLTPYYEALGTELVSAFDSFKENYTTVSSGGARSIAFTFYLNYYNHPSCFFGPGYQSLMTYVHEQGHYISMFRSYGMIQSMDLSETQSQGNEWMYLSYLQKDDPAFYAKVVRAKMLDDLISIVLCTCCDAFEQYIYAHKELTSKDYDKVFIEIAQSFDAYDFLKSVMRDAPESYWHKAIVSNSFYYLSYAVSLIPDIELYVLSMEKGFDKAAGIYVKLTKQPDDPGFVEALVACGLSSPFEEEVFKNIYNYFES